MSEELSDEEKATAVLLGLAQTCDYCGGRLVFTEMFDAYIRKQMSAVTEAELDHAVCRWECQNCGSIKPTLRDGTPMIFTRGEWMKLSDFQRTV